MKETVFISPTIYYVTIFSKLGITVNIAALILAMP